MLGLNRSGYGLGLGRKGMRANSLWNGSGMMFRGHRWPSAATFRPFPVSNI